MRGALHLSGRRRAVVDSRCGIAACRAAALAPQGARDRFISEPPPCSLRDRTTRTARHNLVRVDIDNRHRAAVVAEWLDAQSRGEPQSDFCARQDPPIAPRTLRLWTQNTRALSLPEDTPLSELVRAAIHVLVRVAEALEATDVNGMPAASSDEPVVVPDASTDASDTRAHEPRREKGRSFWDPDE